MGTAVLLALLLSQPGPFTLVNGTGATLEQIQARAADSKLPWLILGPGRLSAGARGAVPAFGGEQCAFDVQAKVGDTTVRWNAVNLCDVKSVTLHRRADGTLWVDYD